MNRMLRITPGLLLVCFLLAAAAADVTAQEQRFERVADTETNIESYYYYVQSGAAFIEVRVLGTVRAPGLYVLAEDTNVGQILALSGGPVLDARQGSTERTVIVRHFRPQNGQERLLHEEEFVEGAFSGTDSFPDPASGDVLTVEVIERQRFVWRDLLTVVNTLAVIALAAAQL